jgi:formamidopyrimidine-DNA glycosylase
MEQQDARASLFNLHLARLGFTMPELAEVEYFRRQWNAGIGHRVIKIALHADKRVFRDTNTPALRKDLAGARLLTSEARGKRMLFRFSNENWLGLHLGMSGKMQTARPDFRPQKHDHFVLYQRKRALVFTDARQFGRVQFHHGKTAPAWWDNGVPEIVSDKFDHAFLERFLDRHRKAPIKAVVLMQSGFSGIGNWMADEILWRAKILPSKRAGKLSAGERDELFRATKFVARESLRIIGPDDSTLPRTWLIHERWRAGGKCPRHKTVLRRATIGGRTTAWCPKCQRSRHSERESRNPVT